MNDEQVRGRCADDVPVGIAQQALVDSGVAPFASRQHLLQAIEMLEAGDCGLW